MNSTAPILLSVEELRSLLCDAARWGSNLGPYRGDQRDESIDRYVSTQLDTACAIRRPHIAARMEAVQSSFHAYESAVRTSPSDRGYATGLAEKRKAFVDAIQAAIPLG